MQCSPKIVIKIGARSSPLSLVQVEEILEELHRFYPPIVFDKIFFQTTGDQDLKTSLRDLERTDFFTKEIDEAILKGVCRLGIHSAKDLPYPLTPGLELICLTKGIDPSDSLVLREHQSLMRLPSGSKIATSSVRREEAVRKLRDDLEFCDIRGTIQQRLHQLDCGNVDGVVIAEAALIRLKLLHLNRIRLGDSTAEGQGQLAIVAKEEDGEMKALFSCMDSRQTASNSH